jgi:hypothetical protein
VDEPIIRHGSPTVLTDLLARLPPLGVGILYNDALPDFLRSDLGLLDYVEVIPDMFQMDRGPTAPQRYLELESWVEILNWLAERRPIIGHNIGMSIGSAGRFDYDYIEQIGHWRQRYRWPWHSDHLSFITVPGEQGNDHNAGLAVPVPYDEDVLELIAARIAHVQRTVPSAFLIENNVYYIDIPEQEMTEAQFLNRLTARTGCGLLLDVHNVYANARNHGFDPHHFVDEIDLSRVVEVHVAGGNDLAGMYTDSHAGPCPEPVWQLLDQVVAHAPNLCGITFEFHDSYYPLLKEEGIRAQLRRARAAWDRYR